MNPGIIKRETEIDSGIEMKIWKWFYRRVRLQLINDKDENRKLGERNLRKNDN